MASLHSVVAALRDIHAEPPSAMRLEYLLYLCDWYYTLLHRKRLVNAEWQVVPMSLVPKLPPHQRSALESNCEGLIDDEAMQVAHVIFEKTRDITFKELIEMVRGTFPLTRPTIYSELDLISCAAEYHAVSPEKHNSANPTPPNNPIR